MPTTGPSLPTAATGNTATIGGGTRTWTTPTNIELADGVFTTCALLASTTSDDLIGTGFGFAVTGTDTINGILLEINYKDNNGVGSVNESLVKLLKAGAAVGASRATGAVLPAAATTVSFGGPADLWGTTWTPADINNATFGAIFTCNTNVSGLGASGLVDFFRITVTSTAAAGGTTAKMIMVF